jgi:hypothetical protein
MKLALETAEKMGIPVKMGGLEIDDLTLWGLRGETRFDVIPLIWNATKALKNKHW